MIKKSILKMATIMLAATGFSALNGVSLNAQAMMGKNVDTTNNQNIENEIHKQKQKIIAYIWKNDLPIDYDLDMDIARNREKGPKYYSELNWVYDKNSEELTDYVDRHIPYDINDKEANYLYSKIDQIKKLENSQQK